MRQTEHYGLNQWDLTDRIQHTDFNADNLKIAAALAGLDSRAAELTEQLGGFATLEALESAKADLEGKQMQHYYFRGASNENLQFTKSGNQYVLNTVPLELDTYAIYRLQFTIIDDKSDTYYINPIIKGVTKKGKCLSTEGSSSEAMILVPMGPNVDCFFFPMYRKVASLGTLFLGGNNGVGSYRSSYYSLEGLSVTPASGTLDPAIRISVDLDGIK